MAKWGRKKIRSGNCCFYAQDIGWNLLLESVDIYYLLGLFQATSKDRMGNVWTQRMPESGLEDSLIQTPLRHHWQSNFQRGCNNTTRHHSTKYRERSNVHSCGTTSTSVGVTCCNQSNTTVEQRPHPQHPNTPRNNPHPCTTQNTHTYRH